MCRRARPRRSACPNPGRTSTAISAKDMAPPLAAPPLRTEQKARAGRCCITHGAALAKEAGPHASGLGNGRCAAPYAAPDSAGPPALTANKGAARRCPLGEVGGRQPLLRPSRVWHVATMARVAPWVVWQPCAAGIPVAGRPRDRRGIRGTPV